MFQPQLKKSFQPTRWSRGALAAWLKGPVFLTLALGFLAFGLLAACGGSIKTERYKLEVTLGKTTPRELVRLMGPPIERSARSIDQPLERLHFNVPFNRNVHVLITDGQGQTIEKVIRGKNVLSFYFVEGLLSSVE
ncbi:MAG: hypothetical protein LBE80_09145 [Deltaproteobacteria bacterium]|jgi:hypothetical protein|nr:hypothetical protein [Deltaproteobacteria bacterium]